MTSFGSDRRLLLIALAVLGCLAVGGAIVLQIASPATLARLTHLVLTGTAVLAGLTCAGRAASSADARSREAWLLFAGAALTWGAGALFESYHEFVTGLPSSGPSAADLGYLLSGPLFAIGLIHLAAPDDSAPARLRALVDGLTISVAFLLVGWVTVLAPTLRGSDSGLLGQILLVSRPAVDIALISLAVHVGLRTRGSGLRTTLPVGFLAPAVIIFALADSAHGYLILLGGHRDAYPVEAGLLVGFVLVLIAALARPRTGQSAQEIVLPHHLGLLLPYFFIVAATAVSVIVPQVTGEHDAVTAWIRSALITLMVVRQLFTLRENEILTSTLEQRVGERTQELEHSRQQFQALVENSSDVLSLVDRDGRILYTSGSANRVYGVPPQTFVGANLRDFLDEASGRRMSDALAGVAGTHLGMTVLEVCGVMPGDRSVTMETTVTNLLDDPAVQAIVLNSRDITERRRLEDELVRQAFHDPLTGLANRALFLDRVHHAVGRRANGGESLAVLFLDLDGFKEVNDSLGHATGDALLIEVARRLSGCLRPGDTIARLGGDEFAVLVEGAAAETSFVGTAHRLRQALEAAVVVDGQELFIRASIGIAATEVGTMDADQLIRNADLAMYRAKERQDGQPALYDPSMHSSLVERLELEAELRRAATDGQQLEVYYQPTYDLGSSGLVGVEALLRWRHPERGMVPPDAFIPAAEQTGMIHEIGRFVLRRACAQGQEWTELNPTQPLTIGVNVSGKQLQRNDFADEVRQALADSGLSASQLVLEMTESVLMNDTDATLATLRTLKQLGVRVAIDDFGTGYSSLSYLHRFPVDILKIDRSFVERLSGDDAQDSLVESIIQLGRTLDLETIAEGIEAPDQLHALRRLGCALAQGYHFGRPGPAETVTQLVRAAQAEQPPVTVVA